MMRYADEVHLRVEAYSPPFQSSLVTCLDIATFVTYATDFSVRSAYCQRILPLEPNYTLAQDSTRIPIQRVKVSRALQAQESYRCAANSYQEGEKDEPSLVWP